MRNDEKWVLFEAEASGMKRPFYAVELAAQQRHHLARPERGDLGLVRLDRLLEFAAELVDAFDLALVALDRCVGGLFLLVELHVGGVALADDLLEGSLAVPLVADEGAEKHRDKDQEVDPRVGGAKWA